MDSQQVQNVQAIMDRFWAVEDLAPIPEDPTVLAAAQVAVNELQVGLKRLEGDDDPLNVGRTWRYLGDVYFSLSGKRAEGIMRNAREAYLKAEPLLNSADDTAERAKLQFNLANTTRLLDGGQNREFLEEAKRRYFGARELFKTVMPEAVATVESSLQSLEIMLQGLGFLESAAAGKAMTENLIEEFKAVGDDPAKLVEIRRKFEAHKTEDESPENMLARFRGFADGAAPLLEDEAGEAAAAGLADARGELNTLLEGFQNSPDSTSGSDAELFQMVFGALEKASANGEVSAERQAALRSVLDGFQRLVARSANTPEEMARKSTDMREYIEQYKSIFMDPEMGGE